ncbi:antitoxin Xre/MbcA/ParS toxin-binding domain-containing protein [Pseudomonas oryzihabitans]|uniref:antitoxin Xre/MbcA/ParS toxin-binding domain-containing protein n=1 Tax=Pseudomonas oryzihabitans TaxID=47885 RepID=UPI003460A300
MISLKIPTISHACWSLKHRNYLIQKTNILYQAIEILGSYKSALRWFESPARGLNGALPCQALNRKSGYLEIQLLLKRIDYGVYI